MYTTYILLTHLFSLATALPAQSPLPAASSTTAFTKSPDSIPNDDPSTSSPSPSPSQICYPNTSHHHYPANPTFSADCATALLSLPLPHPQSHSPTDPISYHQPDVHIFTSSPKAKDPLFKLPFVARHGGCEVRIDFADDVGVGAGGGVAKRRREREGRTVDGAWEFVRESAEMVWRGCTGDGGTVEKAEGAGATDEGGVRRRGGLLEELDEKARRIEGEISVLSMGDDEGTYGEEMVGLRAGGRKDRDEVKGSQREGEGYWSGGEMRVLFAEGIVVSLNAVESEGLEEEAWKGEKVGL